MKISNNDVKLNWRRQRFSSLLSKIKITQKNMCCAHKIRVIYFCLICVNILLENAHYFIFVLAAALPAQTRAPVLRLLLSKSLVRQLVF